MEHQHSVLEFLFRSYSFYKSLVSKVYSNTIHTNTISWYIFIIRKIIILKERSNCKFLELKFLINKFKHLVSQRIKLVLGSRIVLQLPFFHFFNSLVQRTDKKQYQEELHVIVGADFFSMWQCRECVLFLTQYLTMCEKRDYSL